MMCNALGMHALGRSQGQWKDSLGVTKDGFFRDEVGNTKCVQDAPKAR